MNENNIHIIKSPETKSADLINFLLISNIQILIITETKLCSETAKFYKNNLSNKFYLHFNNSNIEQAEAIFGKTTTKTNSCSGLLILIAKSHFENPSHQDIVPGMLTNTSLTLRKQYGSNSFKVLSLYSPHKFYRKILYEKVLNNADANKQFLIGDFNDYFCNEDFFSPKNNKNKAKDLQSLIEKLNFKHSFEDLDNFTFYKNDYCSRIDYIFNSKDLQVSPIKIEDPPIKTDHNLISVDLLYGKKKKKTAFMISENILKNEKFIKEINETIEKEKQKFQNDPNNLLSAICKKSSQIARKFQMLENFKRKKKRKKI